MSFFGRITALSFASLPQGIQRRTGCAFATCGRCREAVRYTLLSHAYADAFVFLNGFAYRPRR
jgi:bacterioferritin-associated ferredoxin